MQGIDVTLEELLSLRHMANQLYLPTPNRSHSLALGNYHSSFRGRGMDFVENRIYQPGDDIRAINWSVTARTGKAHTKVYQQERERPIYVVIDFNSSMFFGTRTAFKSVIAARIATLIAWAALKNGDRIGAILIKEDAQIFQPSHRKQNLIALLKNIVNYSTPDSVTNVDVATALNKLKRGIKSGSLIYFLSDYYSWDSAVHCELQYLAKKHQITNVFIYDPLEKNLPVDGQYLFHDFCQKRSILVDTYNKRLDARYSDIFNERLLSIKKLSFSLGMHLFELATNQDIIKAARQILHRKIS